MAENHHQNVRRRLSFGSDGEQVPSLAQQIDNITNQELERKKDEMRTKWNFDFENDLPLEGDWEWEEVAPVERMGTTRVVNELKRENENRNV